MSFLKVMDNFVSKIRTLTSDDTMCYRTAKVALDSTLDRESLFLTINNGPLTREHIENKLKQGMLITVETKVISRRRYSYTERGDLLRKYNMTRRGIISYTFKEEQLRLLTHAFNLRLVGDSIKVYQSWFGVTSYRELLHFKLELLDSWLERLNYAMCFHASQPRNFYSMFGILKDGSFPNKRLERIVLMLEGEKMEVDTVYTIEY